jgi:hypothetical protein
VLTKEEFKRAIFNYSLMYHQTRRAAVLPGIKRCFGEFSTAYATHQRVQVPFVLSLFKAKAMGMHAGIKREHVFVLGEGESQPLKSHFCSTETRGMLIRRVINAVV